MTHVTTAIPDTGEDFSDATASEPAALRAAVAALRQSVHAEAQRSFARWRPAIRRREFLGSAENLAHYLAMRRRDLRALQAELVPWGLSSLGRSEPHVLATLDAVSATLGALCGVERSSLRHPPRRAFERSARRLQRNIAEMFGASSGRHIRIMVTLSAEAADDPLLLDELVTRGMDCARINCAHDDRDVWTRLTSGVRAAAAAHGRRCVVLMDLAGPKIRLDEVRTPGPTHRTRSGDRILLVRGPFGDAERYPIQVRVSIPQLTAALQPGAAIWIDDGKVEAVVDACEPEGAVVRVVNAGPKGVRIAPDKGINVPGLHLQIPALTCQDLTDLDFVAEHADIIGYSFVQSAEDVATLQAELRQRLPAGVRLPPLVAKIETQRALENLPSIVVQAAGAQPFGVMIARGDLAIEIGYERLAEIQEELLWICEAAQIPVIWATQVLERLVKEGVRSRAEMTDAAMAERADCVMLNKGPFVAEAVTVLDDVLRRMQSHQRKKASLLRSLHVWDSAGK